MFTLTIAELEEELRFAKEQGATDDTPVHIAYNYNDHWRTTVAPTVRNAELTDVTYSEYHRMHKITENEYDDEESKKRVFVIGTIDN